MYNKFHLEIITPERVFFQGDVEELLIISLDGETLIMKGHHPLVAAVATGSLRIMQDGEWKEAANSEGFVKVTGENVTVMVQSAEWPEEIEINREQADIARAEERMRQKRSMLEYKLGTASLARAFARIKVKSKYGSGK